MKKIAVLLALLLLVSMAGAAAAEDYYPPSEPEPEEVFVPEVDVTENEDGHLVLADTGANVPVYILVGLGLVVLGAFTLNRFVRE